MACTTFNCPSCGIGYSGACCPTCQPAQSIYQGECQDPGTLNPGRFLEVLDYKFCHRRLSSGEGFLVSNINGAGNAGFTWTTTPQVALTEMLATEGVVFGNLIVMGSDSRWRYLQGPSTLGLFMQTDANGMVYFGDPPAATVPDPLNINNLSVAATATINDLTTNGTVTLNNVVAGTVVNLLGLDVSNEVVLQSLAAGIAASMFYETSTSPNATAPNKNKVNGTNLIIGNRLFDSGANLISVTTGESLTVNVPGKYFIAWAALCRMGSSSKAMASLAINNVVVNNAGRNDAEILPNPSGVGNYAPFTGIEIRPLAAGDVLTLPLSTVGVVNTYNVRLIALKFADA